MPFSYSARYCGRRHRSEFVCVRTVEKICAQKHTPAGTIEAGVWIGDLPDRQVGVGDAAVDRLVLFPEAALELQADFDGWRVGDGVDGCLHAIADVDRKLAQNGQRNRADAPIGFGLLWRRRSLEIRVGDCDAAVILLYPGHFRVVTNDAADFPRKRLADHVHATHRLKHRGLESMECEILQVAPDSRFQDVGQIDRLARDRRSADAAARILGVTAIVRGNEICLVSVVAVQRAPRLQRLHQDFAIFLRYSFVELALLRCLGKQFRNLSLKIGLDVANALRNASERLGRVQKGVVIELDERLKGDTQALAVIEDRAMVIRNPPWAGIEIEALLEFTGLLEATKFSE